LVCYPFGKLYHQYHTVYACCCIDHYQLRQYGFNEEFTSRRYHLVLAKLFFGDEYIQFIYVRYPYQRYSVLSEGKEQHYRMLVNGTYH
jgi:hypothetical protein